MVHKSVDHGKCGRFVLYRNNKNFIGELDRKSVLSQSRV